MIHIFHLVLLIAVVLSGCSTDDRVQQLLDQGEVIKTINTLFIETDNRNWTAVKTVFAESVLLDMTSMVGGRPAQLSPQQIIDAWDKGLKPLQAIHHQAGNYIVTVKGSEAEAFCYGIASHYLPNPSNQNTRIFVGSYNFHLTKHGQGWMIDKLKFNLKYIDGNKDLTNPSKQSK